MLEPMDEFLDENGQPRLVERRFVVEEPYAGHRLDHYLKRKIPRLSRTRLQQIIRTQLIGPAGRRLKASSTVHQGDELVIRRPARAEPSCPRELGVLYRDEHLLVIDKPAGLPVHASAKFYFNTLTRVLAETFPGEPLQIAHRLDRETSGIMIVARGRAAASRLKTAFARKQARKTYLAVVRGVPPWADGEVHEIDLPLALTDEPGALDVRMVARPGAPPALTRVSIALRRPRCALVRCEPVTGRQHQIRAHLAAAGHPIVGDKIYGQGDDLFREYCARGLTPELLARLELPRHALHAASIEIAHPASGEPMRFESGLPADLRDFLGA
ncbi:MAG TPA: RluA family pseudouridine synthase [Kofleriaceae bacterium]|nr:RluA family pseudouridine synthase [Kofleriaceae bacterium]